MMKCHVKFVITASKQSNMYSLGVPAFAQSKHLWRHNAALKIVFFEMLKDLELVDKIAPWCIPV